MSGRVCYSSWVVCGLRSATRTRVPAHWASWADSLRMIRSRHPESRTPWSGVCPVEQTQECDTSAPLRRATQICELEVIPLEWEDLLTALPRLAALVPGVLAIPENGW